MSKLTKREVTREIASRLGIPLREGRELLEKILDSMVRALQRGERIEIRGFGTFSAHYRRARRARNPSTGAIISVVEKRITRFRPAQELKGLVNSAKKGLPGVESDRWRPATGDKDHVVGKKSEC